ncbi:hypothetical protein SAMN05660831_00072 [Thiohalospira halophila DSM 15071]|uniref:Uncharacterized protein n=1 Tax=Thiohalospira halophila DSM 15071 TaxID=1123397 RepID=A0A1I1N1Z1_9GAMM|nr:hypothetical protein [Thiohalospira halophila]SFC91661.1 hypothetical protein SAMN05660831_00072 [Thiohalospira halophila DSM 15071]
MKALLKDPFTWVMAAMVAGAVAWMVAGMPGWPGQEEAKGEAHGEIVILDPSRVMEKMREEADDPDAVTAEAVARRLKAISGQLTEKGYIVLDAGVVFDAPEDAFVEIE